MKLSHPAPRPRRYTALVYRSGSTATPMFNFTLTADGTTSFEEELTLPAGPYQLEIATANVHGAGAQSALSAEFTVGEAGPWPGCGYRG